jgi:hypothetical protein
MADDGVYTTNADIVAAAGANVNSTAASVTETDKYVLQVEAYVNNLVLKNYSAGTEYADLTSGKKEILKMISASMCAIRVIQYDMRAVGLAEAQSRVDILRDWIVQASKMLRETGNRDFLADTS